MANYRRLLLLAFVAGAFAGPLSYWEPQGTTCATTCPENTKFIYEPGKTYDYQYESDMKTWVNGATDEHSSLHMRATVQLEVLSRCEMVLKLSDVTLQDSNPEQYESRQYVERAWEFTRSLQEKPLRFAFLDGEIENICPEEEPAWVLNIKRGILSALQNTMPTLDSNVDTRETDVSGDCPVEYEVSSEGWGSRKIKKTKDIMGCTERHGHMTAFQSSPYKVDSGVQSLPLMKSTHECQQEINSAGLLVESSCAEEHIFRPFSSGSNGAMTAVYYKIRFNKESPGIRSRQDAIRRRSPLIFDHTPTPEELEENYREAQKSLTQICRETRRDIRPEVPHLFSQLVRQMKMMDSRTLGQLATSARQGQPCPMAEKFIRDAVPILGTAASVAMMRDQIRSGEVDGGLLDFWVSHMAFYPTISMEMLEEAKPLLTAQPVQSKVVLAVSTMVNSYCRLNPECENERTIQEMARILEQRLNYNCRAGSVEDHDMILMSLKALGNMGHSPSVLPVLVRCVKTEDIPMELRIAAMQSFRRMGCSAERNELLSLFTNQVGDSELRINAYLAVMQCANPSVLTTIRETLASEQVNQVGSFVWTHLTNLMETSSPHKTEIREILDDMELAKEFDLDKRKFSRNIEWSAFSEGLNLGAMAETNLIWATDSYIPRSGSLNLTIDMFGSSVNLMEVGGRMEGFEGLLEKLFGEDKEINDVVGRGKREAVDTRFLNRLDQAFGKDPKEPHATYYVKVFGNELRYGDFHGLDMETLKDKLNYLDWLIELAKDHSFDQTYSTMFLDTTVNIPTCMGMPLKLSVDGTATVNLKVRGKMDIRQLFTSPASMDVTGTVSPSGAVEINAEMEVNAFVARTGLRMTTTLHTSTSTDGSIKLQDGKIFNVEFNMPQDKMEVISAESKFYVMYRDIEREQSMSGDRVEREECIRGKLTKALGLEACGELSFPKGTGSTPWFPFSGPARASLVLNKKDTFSKYEFEAKYIKTKSNNAAGEKEIQDVFRMAFNTPGSRIDRELTAEFTMNRYKTANLNIRTPWKRATVTGELVNTAEQKKVEVRGTIDGNQEYSILAEVLIEEKTATFFTPNVQITMPRRDPITLGGRIQFREGKRLDMNMRLENLFSSPLVLDGNYLVDSKHGRTDGELNMKSSMLDGKVTGRLSNADGTKAVRLTTEYSYNHGPQRKLSFNTKLRDKSTEDNQEIGFSLGWESSFYPKYNGDVSADFSMDDKAMSVSLNGGFDDVRRMTFSKASTYTLTGPTRRLETSVKFEFPYKNWKNEMDLQHMHSRNEVKTTLNIKTPVPALFDLHVQREAVKPLKMSADVKLHYPGREMSWMQTVQENEPNVYDHNLAIQLQKYQTVTVTSVYRTEPRHEVTAQITIPDMEPITVSGYLNPSLTDMQVGGELNFNRQVYLVNTNWEVKGNTRVFDSKSGWELKIPNYHYKTEATLTRKYMRFTGNMEMLMDATNNPNAKVTVNGDIKLKMETPSIVLQVAWPGKFVNIDASGGYETEGWYASKKDVHGKINVKTSFRGYDNLEASFKHDWSQNGIETNGEVSWASNRKMSGDFLLKKLNGWSSVETTVDVSTPYYNWRAVKATSKYTLGDNSLETTNTFQWDNQQMQLGFKGEMDLRRHMLDGRITFSSPFRGFEDLSLTGRHTDNGRNFNSNLEASWARGQAISTRFTMQHQRRGWALTNNGELSISTPFPDARQMGLTWQHSNSDSDINCHYELMYNNKKSVYDMEGTHTTSNGVRLLTGKAVISSPYTGRRSLEASHSHELMSWRNIKTSAIATWDPRTRLSYNQEISVTSSQLNVDAKFTSPFPGFMSIDLDLQTQKQGNTYSTKNELKWDGNNKISLIGSVSITGYEVVSNLRFTTPYEPVERILLNINNRKQADIWVSHADLEFAVNKKIEIDTQFGMDRTKKMAVNIKTPFQLLRSFSMDQTVRGTLRDFRLDGEVDYDLIGGKTTLSITFDTANLDDIKTKLSFRCPFPEVSSIKIIASHKRQGARFISDASLSYPGYRGSATNDMTIRSLTDFTSTTAVEYLPSQRIELATEYKMDPAVKGTVTFRSPFRRFEEISLTFNHQGSPTNFRSGGEISYSPSDKLTANGEFNMRGASISGSARMTSPYRSAERINIDFHHNGDDYMSFTNGGNFELNRMKYGAENEFSLRGTNMKASTTITTPHRDYETIGLNINHRGGLTNFNNDATVTYGTRRMTGSTEFALNGEEISGKVTATSPFPEMRTLEASFNHNAKKWSNFENSANVMYNNQRYSGESRMKWFKSGLTGEAKVNIPDEYGVMLRHKGEPTDFNTKAEITVAGHPSTASTTFKYEPNNIEGTATLVTPYRNYENFEGSFSHSGNLNSFKTEAEVQIPRKRFSGVVNFKNLEITQGSIDIVTPFPNWESTGAGFTHSGSPRRFETTGNVKTSFPGYEQFKGKLTHRGDLNRFNSGLLLESSVPRFERIETKLAHNGDISAMNTDASVETTIPGYERFSFNLDHDGRDPSKVKSSVKVETPFRGMERFGANMEHTGDMRRFTTSARVNSPIRGYERFGLDVDHRGDLDNFRTTSKLTTPFPAMREATVAVNHRGNLRDFNSGGSLEYNGKKMEGAAMFKQSHPDWLNADYEGSMSVSSPYDVMRNVEISGAHSRSTPRKTGSMQLMYNGGSKADLDYEYTATGRRNIRVTVREPHPMEAKVSYELGTGSFSGDADLNWNTQTRGSTIRFDTNLKNLADTYTVDRSVAFKTTLPTRTVGISTGYTKQADKLSHNAEFQWDKQERSKIGYELEVSKNSRRSLEIYDGKFSLNSAMLPFETTFNHRTVPGRQFTTEVALIAGDKLTIRNDVTLKGSDGFSHTLTLQHPRFSRDAVISTEGTMTPNLLDGSVEVAYEREQFTFAGKLQDESTAGNMKMSGSMALKHPNSMLDIQWNGELINNRQVASGNMEAKYLMTKTRQTKIASIRTEIKKLQHELEFELVTPIKKVTMTGRRTSPDQYTGEIKSGPKTISGDLSINRETRQADLTLNTSPYDALYLSVQYQQPRTMNVEISRKERDARVKDLSVSMNLLSDNMISGRSSIRPGLWTDLKRWYGRQDMSSPVVATWNEVYPVWAEDAMYKKTYLGRAMKPIQDAATSVHEDVAAKWSEFDRVFDRMYYNNDFYIQDAYKSARRTYRQVDYNVRHNLRKLEKATADMRVQIDAWKQTAQAKYDVMYAQYAPIVNHHYQNLKSQAQQKYIEYKPHFDNLGEEIRAKLMDLAERIRTNPKVQAWIARLTAMTPEEYLLALRDWSPKASVWQLVKDWPVMKPVKQWAKTAYNKIEYTYETYLKDVVDSIYDGGLQYIKDTLWEKVNNKLHLDEDKWTVWDPQRGEYAFQFYVPVWPMEMLRDMPELPEINIDIGSALMRLKYCVTSWLPEDDWYMSDLFYKYKPSTDYKNWIPPFKSRATLAGSQHYMTFDKRFFEYTGECSYLLARDFLDGEFSVIVNYERIRDVPTKKSISVISKTHQFEIFPSAKVLMDGSEVLEMPVQKDETTIIRTPHQIRIDNKHGVTVTCNLEHDRCTVNVTGWYFARTGGMLGTYNNEPVDDFMTPGGSIAANEAELADTWTVGQRCRQNNYATDVATSPDNHHYKLCSKYFIADDSPFRSCFKVVQPEPFMRMCLNDMPTNINSIPSEEDLCSMAHFYVEECKAEGVPVRVPKVCVRCDLHEDKHFIEGENITMNKGETPEAADIVFVIQHHTCTQEPIEQLQEIADKIYKAYKADSIKDIEFAVVGFGGKGVEQGPHIHTMEGRLFNSREKLVRVVDNFDTEAGDHDDVMGAVHYAAKLPFRAGVAKSIILITCDLAACQEKSINYLDLQEILIERDIKLHYLLEHEFATKKGKPTSIYGVDDSFVYTKKDAKHLKGNAKLRPHVSMPKNLCAVLAEETDGSIFDIQKWRDVKPVLGDKFEDAFTKLVAKKGTPTKCQNCECVPDESGVGMAICRSCSYNDGNSWFDRFLDEPEQTKEKKKEKKDKKDKNTNKPRGEVEPAQ